MTLQFFDPQAELAFAKAAIGRRTRRSQKVTERANNVAVLHRVVR
jgi:hypothetical protein